MCKGVNPTKSNSTGIGVRPWRMTRRVLHAKRPPRKRLRTNGVLENELGLRELATENGKVLFTTSQSPEPQWTLFCLFR